jgi:glycine rich protein
MNPHFARRLRPVLILSASGLAAAAFAAPASATTQTFAYTGVAQTWVVPPGVTQATFDLRGASGGANGGRATASIPLTPGESVQVNVGGSGSSGGFNGGGQSEVSPGGGATDIRIGGTALTDRVLVAGGGGGGMSAPPIPGGQPAGGGGGGGLNGQMGGAVLDGAGGPGGTQTGGGGSFCGTGSGTLGKGGDSLPGSTPGGGGGGGYYGGGAGCLGGGGGGSGYGPIGTQFETGTSGGNGSATVEYVAAPDAPPSISGLTVSPRRFPATSGPTKLNRRADGATVELTLSEDADVSFRIARNPPKGAAGSRPTGSLRSTLSLEGGTSSFPLERLLDGTTLKPRRYTLKAVATDAAGQTSHPAGARFRVLRP